MDPALLKERELFKKKALTTPTVEKKKTESKPDPVRDEKKSPNLVVYKTASGSSQYRFGVLAKIVKHMRTRHQEGETHPLSLDEILDETNQLDVGNKVKQWLQTEALVNNPKIEVSLDNKFIFKALYRLKDRKSLLKLLKQQDLKGLGGVLLEDVQESLPHCDKALRILQNQNEIIFIIRPMDKKKVLFYNDRTANLPIDEEFQKLWRSVAVDAMDDAKIEEYLDKQGIRSMQDHGPKKPMAPKRKKAGQRKKVFKRPRDNEHLADVLENYETDTITQKKYSLTCYIIFLAIIYLVILFSLSFLSTMWVYDRMFIFLFLCKMFLKYTLFTLIFYSITSEGKRTRVKRIVGGIPADVPPVDEPVVYTSFVGKTARVEGVRDFPHYVFRGIKYAHPPTGKNRFLRSIQKFLEGDITATRFAPPCVQPRPGTDNVIGKEDCLALNVFTPELPTGLEGLPVVVWIHGGGFRYGSASQYGVRHLVGKRVIVVTIQYRLGSLGFLSSGDKHLPGNVALWDMVLAIQWVRNYIGFFGGNPYRITVMGHGTGASSALLLVLSNVAKGLTSGVIAMSGTAVSNWAVDHTPQHTAADIAQQNGCPSTSTVTMVRCLQNLPPESIIRGDSNVEFERIQSRGFMSSLSGGLGSAPVSEGFNDGRSLPGFIEDEPINDLNKENHPKIPLLTGVTRDETKRAIQGHLRKDVQHALNAIPNFVNDVLVKHLRGLLVTNKLINTQLTGSNTDSILPPLNFENYFQTKKENLFDVLDKVAEATTDTLFNLPAFLTVNRWSKSGSPTFLYSFEHLGKRQKGSAFLRGTPIMGNDTIGQGINDTIGHGDDLAYLFEVNDVEGNTLETEEKLNDDDEKVRDIFTQMIADFARYGKITIEGEDVKSFSNNKNNFIQVKAKPAVANNFRICQIALWCNLIEQLKSSMCSFLDAFKLKNLPISLPLPGVLNETIPNIIIKPDIIKPINNPVLNQDSLNILDGGVSNKNPNKITNVLGGILG
ncbi:hypothetical protein NQ317_017248 [Molorchus minor]|uniref:TFIIE beta domain-containing protein n=1 Tax=Molorchus minor TaxID=1323400 RepID=A0ABQ9J2C1_9CUCU|nr:hypothetical protein NQ317_017248 [Molorchus minor]